MFTAKDLRKLILPLIVEQFLAVTIGMADTIMVASTGEAAMSSVSLVDAINILLINIFSALATGGAIVASQYLGREDNKRANVAAKQLLLVTTAMSVFIMAVCLIGRNPILDLIFGKIEPEVMDNCRVYFFWSALSYPFLAVYNAGAALYRSMGNSKVSMLTSTLMNAINIAGNALLIFGFHMGVAGAAIASLFARMVGAVLITCLLRFKPHVIQLEAVFKLDFQPEMIKNILKFGVPTGLENGMFQIGRLMTQGLVATFGLTATTANAIGMSLSAFPQIPGTAIGLAMVTVVGQCIGARRQEEAKRYTLKLTGLAYLAMGALNLVMLALLPGGHRHLQPLPRHGGAGPGADAVLHRVHHPAVARLLRAAQRAAGRGGRPLYHDGVHRLHVGVPHRVQLPAGQGAPDGGAGSLDRHDHRLGVPQPVFRHPVLPRQVDEQTADLKQGTGARYLPRPCSPLWRRKRISSRSHSRAPHHIHIRYRCRRRAESG